MVCKLVAYNRPKQNLSDKSINSVVDISLSYFSGYIRTAGQEYVIEPLVGTDTGDHVMVKHNNLRRASLHCGFNNESTAHQLLSDTTGGRAPTMVRESRLIKPVIDNVAYRYKVLQFVMSASNIPVFIPIVLDVTIGGTKIRWDVPGSGPQWGKGHTLLYNLKQLWKWDIRSQIIFDIML